MPLITWFSIKGMLVGHRLAVHCLPKEIQLHLMNLLQDWRVRIPIQQPMQISLPFHWEFQCLRLVLPRHHFLSLMLSLGELYPFTVQSQQVEFDSQQCWMDVPATTAYLQPYVHPHREVTNHAYYLRVPY